MNISWVVSDQLTLDPTLDIAQLKEIGSIWGSWRTWRSCQTDNVICDDLVKAEELLQRQFQKNCNFYIPNSVYSTLNRPTGVKLYEGMFIHDVDHREEIVAMHLAATTNDVVLLLGFDFSEQLKNADKLLEHRAHNYRSLTKQAISNNPTVQWVVVDHPVKFRKDLLELSNLGQDTLANIIKSF